MISRLKKKVIILTAASLLALLVLMVSGMNIISYVTLVNESDEIIDYIAESGGKFPDVPQIKADDGITDRQMPKNLPRRFNEELEFETRYFSVVLTSSGDIVRVDTGRIAAVDTSGAVEYAKAVFSGGDGRGFTDNYRFAVKPEEDNRLIIFLDCTRKLDSFRTFLLSSIIVSFAGFIAVLIIIIIISGRIIRPIAESYEKQKRFITDASHELRTPLAIINANVDIIEDEVSDKESIGDIRAQTERLKILTEDLVTLSRMEEGSAAIVKEAFSASEAAQDTAAGFNALAQAKGARFCVSVSPDITVNGDKKAFVKLVSIILDNAVKYTPPGGNIDFALQTQGKNAVLTCKNTVEGEMNREETARVFDRFYRTDVSRNSSSGGYGIGLSIAKAIVDAHGGKISAASPDGHTFLITATFPA